MLQWTMAVAITPVGAALTQVQTTSTRTPHQTMAAAPTQKRPPWVAPTQTRATSTQMLQWTMAVAITPVGAALTQVQTTSTRTPHQTMAAVVFVKMGKIHVRAIWTMTASWAQQICSCSCLCLDSLATDIQRVGGPEAVIEHSSQRSKMTTKKSPGASLGIYIQ